MDYQFKIGDSVKTKDGCECFVHGIKYSLKGTMSKIYNRDKGDDFCVIRVFNGERNIEIISSLNDLILDEPCRFKEKCNNQCLGSQGEMKHCEKLGDIKLYFGKAGKGMEQPTVIIIDSMLYKCRLCGEIIPTKVNIKTERETITRELSTPKGGVVTLNDGLSRPVTIDHPCRNGYTGICDLVGFEEKGSRKQ